MSDVGSESLSTARFPIDVDTENPSSADNINDSTDLHDSTLSRQVDTYDIAEKISNTLLGIANAYMFTHPQTSVKLNECSVLLNALQKKNRKRTEKEKRGGGEKKNRKREKKKREGSRGEEE